MRDRTAFNEKAEEILSFFDAYGVLRCEHLEKFFPGSKRTVNYLIKKERLHKSTDGNFIGTEENPRPDKCLVAALGVLADILDKVQSHVRATAPAQISFLTHFGDYYEILYVSYGMETVITASAQHTAQNTDDHAVAIKRMVIVEDKSQMTRLQLSGIMRFALTHPDGSLSYFKGS